MAWGRHIYALRINSTQLLRIGDKWLLYLASVRYAKTIRIMETEGEGQASKFSIAAHPRNPFQAINPTSGAPF